MAFGTLLERNVMTQAQFTVATYKLYKIKKNFKQLN